MTSEGQDSELDEAEYREGVSFYENEEDEEEEATVSDRILRHILSGQAPPYSKHRW